jgi:hypothetical protein
MSQNHGEIVRAIPQWCSGCKEARTIECVRDDCPTAARLAEDAHYAQINTDLLEAAERIDRLYGMDVAAFHQLRKAISKAKASSS